LVDQGRTESAIIRPAFSFPNSRRHTVAEAGHKKVLVVDDDVNLREMIVQFIRGHGYEAFEAARGQAALDFLHATHVDLIILDIMMPGMDGVTTLKKIREAGNNVPIILLTARSQDEDVLHGYTAGADLYLVKPVSMDTLQKAIEYLVGDLTPEEKAALEREM